MRDFLKGMSLQCLQLRKREEEREEEMLKWYEENLPDPETIWHEEQQETGSMRSEDQSIPQTALETKQKTGVVPRYTMYAENFPYASSTNICMWIFILCQAKSQNMGQIYHV